SGALVLDVLLDALAGLVDVTHRVELGHSVRVGQVDVRDRFVHVGQCLPVLGDLRGSDGGNALQLLGELGVALARSGVHAAEEVVAHLFERRAVVRGGAAVVRCIVGVLGVVGLLGRRVVLVVGLFLAAVVGGRGGVVGVVGATRGREQ